MLKHQNNKPLEICDLGTYYQQWKKKSWPLLDVINVTFLIFPKLYRTKMISSRAALKWKRFSKEAAFSPSENV